MFKEVNTKTNLPCQIDLLATDGGEYHFQFMAKGGGSANKTFLFQQTKALLNEKSLLAFCETQIKALGTAACPPYHLSIVVGGLSAELNLKTVKLASTKVGRWMRDATHSLSPHRALTPPPPRAP
jgi:fumarate hydratase class I